MRLEPPPASRPLAHEGRAIHYGLFVVDIDAPRRWKSIISHWVMEIKYSQSIIVNLPIIKKHHQRRLTPTSIPCNPPRYPLSPSPAELNKSCHGHVEHRLGVVASARGRDE